MNGELLLVECEPLGAALEAMQSAPGVADVAVFGNALHLSVKDATASAPRIDAFLRERGLAPGRIEKIRPTLEDVFVSLTTSSSAEARTA
jgi:ABC-2 type transport system ATP-binding protein